MNIGIAILIGGMLLTQGTQAVISLESMDSCLSLFGTNDQNIPLFESELGVSLAVRGSDLRITGPDENVSMASQVVEKLSDLLRRNAQVDRTTLRYALALGQEGRAGPD